MVLKRLCLIVLFAVATTQGQAAPQRGWLGFAADSGSVIVVRGVAPGSPAMQAGLAVGDRIRRVNGRLATWQLLAATSDSVRAADTVVLQVERGADRNVPVRIVATFAPARSPTQVTMRIARLQLDSAGRILRGWFDTARVRAVNDLDLLQWSDSNRTSGAPPSLRIPLDSLLALAQKAGGQLMRTDSGTGAMMSVLIGRRAIGGAELVDLEAPLSGYLGVAQGVLVLKVNPGSPAARNGILAGDVIVAVDGAPVAAVLRLRELLRSQRTVRLSIVRNHRPIDLNFKFDG